MIKKDFSPVPRHAFDRTIQSISPLYGIAAGLLSMYGLEKPFGVDPLHASYGFLLAIPSTAAVFFAASPERVFHPSSKTVEKLAPYKSALKIGTAALAALPPAILIAGESVTQSHWQLASSVALGGLFGILNAYGISKGIHDNLS